MNDYNNSESAKWETDPKSGRKFKRIGHTIEYETMIQTAGGLIPESQLAEHQQRYREAEERRSAEQAEALTESHEHKDCPFSDSLRNACKRDKCALFIDGECALSIIANTHGTDYAEQTHKTHAAKCPFSIYGDCENCALYNNGCAFVRIAAATKHKKKTR